MRPYEPLGGPESMGAAGPGGSRGRLRIAVVGHVEWVEFIPVSRLPGPGEVLHAAPGFASAAGGGGVAATVLAQLGAEVDFYCALGLDEHGRAAEQQLKSRGLRPHVAWRSGPTRRAVTLLPDGGERTIITLGPRLQPSGDDDLEWDRLDGCDGAYFTAGDAGALALARTAEVLVCSPRAHAAFEPGGPVVDALVLSAHDEQEREWAEGIHQRARLLVATEGAEGGRWWSEREPAVSGRWEAAAAEGEVHDSYGCGDSFAAGFTCGLAAGESIPEAAALGARCGARCLTRVGAP